MLSSALQASLEAKLHRVARSYGGSVCASSDAVVVAVDARGRTKRQAMTLRSCRPDNNWWQHSTAVVRQWLCPTSLERNVEQVKIQCHPKIFEERAEIESQPRAAVTRDGDDDMWFRDGVDEGKWPGCQWQRVGDACELKPFEAQGEAAQPRVCVPVRHTRTRCGETRCTATIKHINLLPCRKTRLSHGSLEDESFKLFPCATYGLHTVANS